MATQIRNWVSELVIFDASDSSTSVESREFVEAHRYGGYTVGAEGVDSANAINAALAKYVNLEQLSFCTHGFPGGVYFPNGRLTAANLSLVQVPQSLYRGPGRLLFMGCETARTPLGEAFLVAAGRRFFGHRGGIVGGATIYTLGFTSGARLPYFGAYRGGVGIGHLKLFKIDGDGSVVASSTT